MSHRDKDCRTGSAAYAQELVGAIDGLLAEVDWKDIRFRKDCEWAVRGLVAAALVWAWSSKAALKDRLAQALRVARGLGCRFAPRKTSYQAFIKLLARWTSELREGLVLAFQVLMEGEFAGQFRQAGYVVLAGDGSKVRLARTRSNETRYSPAKTQRQKGRNTARPPGGGRRTRRPILHRWR